MRFYYCEGPPRFRYYVEGCFGDQSRWRRQMFAIPKKYALAAYDSSDAARFGGLQFLIRGRVQVIAYPAHPPHKFAAIDPEIEEYLSGRVVAVYETLPDYELRVGTEWRIKSGDIPDPDLLARLRAGTGIK
ncbi:MAG: hypothetical protein EOP64_00090 [Sphingomonas sp.]|nr:MAG: hypothetical protein EOP64_00090 [Sphingomonas sp.]